MLNSGFGLNHALPERITFTAGDVPAILLIMHDKQTKGGESHPHPPQPIRFRAMTLVKTIIQ